MRFLRRLLTRKPILTVPEKFNRNSATVTAFMPPDQAALWLLERMRQQLGLASYVDRKILDLGCGVRFTQAMINSHFAIGGYCGVDNFRELIEFLQQNVRDPRFAFHYLDARHPLYNVEGVALSAQTTLPFAEGSFDVVCMFSVITHQYPDDSRAIFRMLRRYVTEDGWLFFTCFLDDTIATFEDRSADQNGGMCFYNPAFLSQLVEECGWERISYTTPEPPLISHSFVYRPAKP